MAIATDGKVQNSGRGEDIVPHCRFTLHLPTNSRDSALASRQSKAAAEKIIYILSRAYTGSTYSSTLNTTFTGFWLDTVPKQSVTYLATVALLILDIPISFSDEHIVLNHIDAIRKLSFSYYAHYKVPQNEIWLAVAPMVIKLYV